MVAIAITKTAGAAHAAVIVIYIRKAARVRRAQSHHPELLLSNGIIAPTWMNFFNAS